jgi:transposase-like protein
MKKLLEKHRTFPVEFGIDCGWWATWARARASGNGRDEKQKRLVRQTAERHPTHTGAAVQSEATAVDRSSAFRTETIRRVIDHSKKSRQTSVSRTPASVSILPRGPSLN